MGPEAYVTMSSAVHLQAREGSELKPHCQHKENKLLGLEAQGA